MSPKNTAAELPMPETVRPGDVLSGFRRGEYDLICVMGPTASGKTRYAVQLAKALNAGCEIISADSRQVYRGMDIGTGKDLAEYDGIPYHLIDVAEPGDGYNVFRFKKEFDEAKKSILERGGIPILCGGTGLYISAVTCGYGFEGEKKPLSCAREDIGRGTFFIGTLVSREVRRERIDRRLDARLEEGMVDEIAGLMKTVPAQTLISYGLEYKFVTLYLLGQLSREEMRVQLATAIHQFAKRQMTWLRGMERSGVRIHWVEP